MPIYTKPLLWCWNPREREWSAKAVVGSYRVRELPYNDPSKQWKVMGGRARLQNSYTAAEGKETCWQHFQQWVRKMAKLKWRKQRSYSQAPTGARLYVVSRLSDDRWKCCCVPTFLGYAATREAGLEICQAHWTAQIQPFLK